MRRGERQQNKEIPSDNTLPTDDGDLPSNSTLLTDNGDSQSPPPAKRNKADEDTLTEECNLTTNILFSPSGRRVNSSCRHLKV